MNDTIAIFNDLVVINQGLISRCCCNVTSGFVYWEAVPCDAYTTVGEYCETINQCSFENRKYVNAQVVCAGDSIRVCECQRLIIPNYSSLTTSETLTETDGATLELTSDFSNGSGIFSQTSLQLIAKHTATNIVYDQIFQFTDYTYLHQLQTAVNNYSPNGQPFNLTLVKVSASGVPNSFVDATYSTALPDTLDIEVGASAFKLTWNGQTTNFVNTVSNQSIVALNLQNQLNALTGLEVQVLPDEFYAFNTDGLFYITFIGESCGIAHNRLQVSHRFVGASTTPLDPYVQIGEYANGEGWGSHTPDQYSIAGSGSYGCPIDDFNSSYPVPETNNGDVTTYCCPQRGFTMGPLQNLPGTTQYGQEFENLENTVYITDGCYKLPPYFFLYGKTGRIYDHPTQERTMFVLPHCNYGNNECDNDVPCNCVPELFTTSFNKDVPWGPFGSYYSGVETTQHPAHPDLGLDLGSSNLMSFESRSGYLYAPSGTMFTNGSWTATTGINIRFRFHRAVPFYIGTEDATFDDRIIGIIDVSTLSTALTVASGNGGVGDTILTYDPSGRSVNDFINDINDIEIESTGNGNCKLFAFCGAASAAVLSNIPAHKINNLSTELFDVWDQYGGTESFYMISNPADDSYGYSASTIFAAPKKYPDMFMENGVAANDYNSQIVTRSAYTPPPCRRTHNLPKATSFDALAAGDRYAPRPFWTSLQGCEETILNIAKYTGGGFDPLARSMTVEMSGRVLYITVASGSTILASSGISSIRTGSGYTHTQYAQDINDATLSWFGVPGSSYRPLIATSGNINDYHVYVDDATWWDGTNPTAYGVGSMTPHNYGYVEPLFDTTPIDLFAGGSVPLTTWVRRRCNWTNDGGFTENDLFLNPCVPPDAGRFEPAIDLECEADTVISGSWLVAYGCNSSVCKTEYYVKAKRCGCTTMYTCGGDGSPPVAINHPFNQATATTCETFTTPTLYICASNIHPMCDIPFLIKVPLQFVCELDEDGNITNEDCAFGLGCQGMDNLESSQCPPYDDIPRDNRRVGYYLPEWGAVHGDYLYNWMNQGYAGWCQYIDPSDMEIVAKENIPRTYPPTSLVMERSTRPFCTTYINALDLGDGDGKYDSLRPLWPLVPPDYIVPITGTNPGWPCFLNHLGTNPLFAYVRPMVEDLNGEDICESGTCGRADIDCNTRCCGCGFICSDGGDPCTDAGEIGPVRNCSRTETVEYTSYVTDQPYSCCIDFGEPQPCNIGGYGCSPAGLWTACFDGIYNFTSNVTFERTIAQQHRAGFTLADGLCYEVLGGLSCCWGPGGTREDTHTYGGCGNGAYYPCCDENPTWGCGADYGNCVTVVETVLPCDCPGELPETCQFGVLYYTPELTPGSNTTLTICPDCSPNDAAEVTTTNAYSNTLNDCEAGQVSSQQDIIHVYTGNNTISGCGYAPGSLPLGLRLGGGSIPFDGSCASWIVDTGFDWLWRGTWSGGYSGTVVIGDTTCNACNFNNSTTPKDYQYISNFELGWGCGLPGFTSVSASGDNYGM